jgi:hypothetical protein
MLNVSFSHLQVSILYRIFFSFASSYSHMESLYMVLLALLMITLSLPWDSVPSLTHGKAQGDEG